MSDNNPMTQITQIHLKGQHNLEQQTDNVYTMWQL